MAHALVLLIVVLCAVFQFFKGNVTRAVATVIVALSATFVSFGYFEMLSSLLDRVANLVPYAYVISFLLLFILSFALLQTVVMFALREPVDFGVWPERIGRPILGIFLGWIISGVLLTAANLAPLPPQWPYARFDLSRPNPDQPRHVLLKADDFVSGWFGLVSRGAFQALTPSAESFSVTHAGFQSRLFLNRLALQSSKKVALRTTKPSLTVPPKGACWYAEGLVDTAGTPVSHGSDQLAVVHMNIRLSNESSPFTCSQVRVVVKERGSSGPPTRGRGHAVYPLGTLIDKSTVRRFPLKEVLTLDRDHGNPRPVDFVFSIPSGTVPVLAQFKLNNSQPLSVPVTAEEAPEVVPFGTPSREETRQPSGESGDSGTTAG